MEKIELKNPSQSSTQTGYNCKPDKCPASAAIDGNPDTNSVTLKPGEIRWWQAELTKATEFDHIMIHTDEWAFGEEFFNK